MAKRKKVMNAREMEQWLIKKGTVSVSEQTKKEPWFKEVSKLPPCLKPSKVAEDITPYQVKEKKNK
jgi:hypothetical protein